MVQAACTDPSAAEAAIAFRGAVTLGSGRRVDVRAQPLDAEEPDAERPHRRPRGRG